MWHELFAWLALEQLSQGGGGSDWLRITNNDCEGTEWNGCWYLKSVVNPVMISNRTEVDRSITDGTFNVLYLQDTQGGYFAKNEFSGGVTLAGNSINNVFTANNYSPNPTTGIAFAACCSGNISIHEALLDKWVSGIIDRIGNPSDTWIRTGLSGDITIAKPSDLSNSRKNYFMSMYTPTGGGITGWGNATHLAGGRLPNAAAGSVYVGGDKLFDSYFPGNGWLGNLGWVCVTTACSYDGTTWTGTWNYLPQSRCLEVDGIAPPTSGQWKACDFVRNTNPVVAGIISWRNVSSGTPGTWQAVYDYDRSIASASTMPSNAQFTSLELTASSGEVPLKVSSRTPVANLTLADDSQIPAIATPGKIMPSALPTPGQQTGTLVARRDSNEPLWSERQTVNTDSTGKYSLLMGIATHDGLPVNLFTESGERWLIISVDGVVQGPKLLDSTPYALRALDSEMLGGHVASEYMLAKDCCSLSTQVSPTESGAEHSVTGWSKNPEASSFGIMGLVTGRNSTAGVFRTTGGGDLLIGTNESGNIFRVDASGRGYFDNAVQIGGADFAEMVPASPKSSAYEPDDVLVIDQASEKHLSVSRKPYSRLIAGVYATKPGIVARDSGTPVLGEEVPLAMIGIVPCKASAENGPIHVGDELVSSATPGHVMRGGKNAPRGTVLGKALQPLAAGKGKISILLYLH